MLRRLFPLELFGGPEADRGAAAADERAPRQAAAQRRGHELSAEGTGTVQIFLALVGFAKVSQHAHRAPR